MSSSVLPVEHATTGDFAAVASHLARRSILMVTRVPSAFLPSLVMPVFFIVAFTGVYASIVLVPGFPTDNIDSWFVPLAAVQGAVFSGVTVGGGVVRDIETRFYDRLLLAPVSRGALVAGPLLGAIGRAQPTVTVTLVIGVLLGARIPGGLLGLVVFYLICTGVALRRRRLGARALVPVPEPAGRRAGPVRLPDPGVPVRVAGAAGDDDRMAPHGREVQPVHLHPRSRARGVRRRGHVVGGVGGVHVGRHPVRAHDLVRPSPDAPAHSLTADPLVKS